LFVSIKVNTTQKANNTKYSKTKLPSYDTRPGNEKGLFYKAAEHTQSSVAKMSFSSSDL